MDSLKLKDSYLYDLIEKRLLSNLPREEKMKKMELLQKVYWFSKVKFNGIYRKSWEPYFRHLERTAEIILKEFEKPTIEKVALALLHDIFEDTYTYVDTIKLITWERLYEKLVILSKDIKNKTTIYTKFPNKLIRNKNYFERLLSCKDENVIDVKLADRIDNLRTIDVFPEEKIKKKIQETKDYILPLAKEHNLEAYKLLLKEISKWEMKFTLWE